MAASGGTVRGTPELSTQVASITLPSILNVPEIVPTVALVEQSDEVYSVLV